MNNLLIDGDLLLHRNTTAVEKDTRFLDRYHILMCDEEAAWCLIENAIHELCNQANVDDFTIVFSDPKDTFRKRLARSTYKADRINNRKPLAYWDLKDRLVDLYDTVEWPDIEADDLMGIISTRDPGEHIIWSLDKDLKQIPGAHLIDDEVVDISLEEADEFFWFQVLAGDVVDGYKGCPGMGTARATKALQQGLGKRRVTHVLKGGKNKGDEVVRYEDVPMDDPWKLVVSHYKAAGTNEGEALLNARMARILRVEDYDKGKVILWTP